MKNNYFGKLFLTIATTTSVLTVTQQDAQAATRDITNYYMQPNGQCNDNNDGLSPSQGLCSLNALSNKLEKSYQNGKARGDINVIYASGKTYEKILGKVNSKLDNFTFAPAAGHKVTFTTSGTQKAIIKGNPKATGNENTIGIIIHPSKNRGGTFVVDNLEFRNLNDGLLINGGVNSSDPYKFNTPSNGVIAGENAPIQNAVVQNNNFIDMGTKYAPGYANNQGKKDALNYQGNGALRFWNTYGLTIKNNNFNNFYQKSNTNLAHVMYGYFSNNVNITNNTFANTNSTVVHGRMGNNWKVDNNTFNNTTSFDISTWYRGKEYSPSANPSYDRNAECKVNEPVIGKNTKIIKTNLFYYLNPINWFKSPNKISKSIFGASENPWCNNKDRVFASNSITYSSSNGGLKIDYNGAKTNGNGNIAKTEIYAVSAKIKTPVLVSTVEGANGSIVLTKSQLNKLGFKDNDELSVSVISVSNKGNKTSSTGNKFSFNLGQSFDTVNQKAVDVPN